MTRTLVLASLVAISAAPANTAHAVNVSVDFADPAGGWTYAYTGDAAAAGSGGFTALDGTWSHDNGSDNWDGSAIGAPNPGGVTAALVDGSSSYARLQDPGDLRGNAPLPDVNRKIFFGHDLSSEGDAVLDNGITISFRAKIATGGVLDNAYARNAGNPAGTPWPVGGDGYSISSNGRGMFGVNQKTTTGEGIPGRISFSLANSADLGGSGSGLIMNDLDGNVISEAVDPGEGAGSSNLLSISDSDLTNWHEFWITIEEDLSNTGTHKVNVYRDGLLSPSTFLVTAGYDSSVSNQDYDLSFMAMGMSNSTDKGAFDVDFFAYKAGVHAPVPEPSALMLAVFAGLGLVAGRARRRAA